MNQSDLCNYVIMNTISHKVNCLSDHMTEIRGYINLEHCLYNRPIPHKLIGWANYFLLKCWGKNHDVMLPFKHCFNGKSVQF